MRAAKVSVGTQHTGTFAGGQMQAQARVATQKVNSHVDILRALTNRAYASLATDATTASATYATLLTANITSTLEHGYLLITFTASTVHITNPANTSFQVVVDGTVVKGCYVTHATVPTALNASMVVRVAVSRGAHTVLLQWQTNNATAQISAASVVTEHASLLVQEAS